MTTNDQAAAADIVEQAVEELTRGKGYTVIKGLFSADQVAQARARVLELATVSAPDVNEAEALSVLNATDHVWNLVDKGPIFEAMAAHPTILAVFSRILGKELKLGSLAARIVQPGAAAQTPHVDYPYWDLYEPDTFPLGINGTFFLNCQSTIMLEDFTTENGATQVAPGTQTRGYFPDPAEFEGLKVQTTGPAGSVMLMTGLLWHGAGQNHTDAIRVGVLGQYLPKFVKPMEDQLRSVRPEVIAGASPALRALLGADYPYPQVLDTARH